MIYELVCWMPSSAQPASTCRTQLQDATKKMQCKFGAGVSWCPPSLRIG